jgi:16S rRNA (cytosine1407-C5)-methyltransferase
MQHAFFSHIQQQHPNPGKFSDFLSACQRPLRKSIRVNTLKISVIDFKILAYKRGWELSIIPWCEEGFWIDDDSTAEQFSLGNSGEHLLGLFYIQEASSMLPPIALLKKNLASNNLPRKNLKILDLAAAPGSKTTQLAAMVNNTGTILANELSASRLKVLHANLARCGVSNSCLSHFDGTELDKPLKGYFDAILVDAPCGGEGTYRKDQKALDNWSLEAIQSISNIQKKLLRSAWAMLKPGGRLVYSTCTLSRGENQDVIQALIDDVAADLTIINLAELFHGAEKATTKEGFLHVWPETFDCEGFFVACLEKSETAETEVTDYKLSGQSPFHSLSSKTTILVQEYFQQHFGFDLSALSEHLKIRNSQREQQIWLFPEQGDALREVMRLQRSGIRVCDLIDSRKGTLIKTKNEFINCFGKQFKSQVVELNASQAEALTKGDNINFNVLDEENIQLEKGEAICLFHGAPLGLAKVIANKKTTDGNIIKLKNNLQRDLLRNNANYND